MLNITRPAAIISSVGLGPTTWWSMSSYMIAQKVIIKIEKDWAIR